MVRSGQCGEAEQFAILSVGSPTRGRKIEFRRGRGASRLRWRSPSVVAERIAPRKGNVLPTGYDNLRPDAAAESFARTLGKEACPGRYSPRVTDPRATRGFAADGLRIGAAAGPRGKTGWSPRTFGHPVCQPPETSILSSRSGGCKLAGSFLCASHHSCQRTLSTVNSCASFPPSRRWSARRTGGVPGGFSQSRRFPYTHMSTESASPGNSIGWGGTRKARAFPSALPSPR